MGVTLRASSSFGGVTAGHPGVRRAAAVFSNGDILVPVFDDSPNSIFFYISKDGGASFTELTGGSTTIASIASNNGLSVFIDTEDEIHLLYCGSTADVGIVSGTYDGSNTITWGTRFVISGGGGNYPIDFVVWKDGSVKYAAVTHWDAYGGEYLLLDIVKKITTVWADHEAHYLATGATSNSSASVDFNHVGDGKTVKNSSPDIYVAWRKSGLTGAYFVKFSYSSSGPTWVDGGDVSLLSTGTSTATDDVTPIIAFDGTRCVMFGYKNTSPQMWVYERDAADTTTTVLTDPSAPGDITPYPLGLMVDYNSGDIYIMATVGDDLMVNRYDRVGTSWDGWTMVADETWRIYYSNMAYRHNYGQPNVAVIGSKNLSSDYASVYYSSFALNTAPTAPTWTAPADGSTQDVASTLLLDWVFNDPDAGDTQSAYSLRHRVGAGSYEYWNGSSWQASEDASTKIAGTGTSQTLAASWGNDTDADHYFAIKTWDAADAGPSPWATEVRVVPSAKDSPTITYPLDLGAVGPAETVTWTVASQTKYRVVVSDTSSTSNMDAGTLDDDTGLVVDSGARSAAVSFPTNAVTRYIRVQTYNDEGLLGDIDEVTVSVAYTPPNTPTLVMTTPTDAITVTVTNPGGGITPTSNDLYRRDTGDTDDGIRVAEGVAVNGAFVDYSVASGKSYEYRARVFGSNGTSIYGAWT